MEEETMEIALMAASLLDRSWEETLDAAVADGIRVIEACGGGHIPKRHFDPRELATSPKALERFVESLETRQLRLCAFSCHGNPLHPDKEKAKWAHEDFAATCEVAAKLKVPY